VKQYDRPEVIVTDLLRSFSSAIKIIRDAELQETRRWLNSRAEKQYQPFWRQEREITKFKSAKLQ